VKPAAPMLLSFNAGYVDTAGFLVLQGLFTAHVTGNFVTFGAAMAHGTSGAVAKLLALPVFCLTILATRMIGLRLGVPSLPMLKAMLTLKILLLMIAAAFALAWGPFDNADGWRAIVTGMTFVCAMAVQNAAHRIHLAKAPPSTLMTGTSTQIMLDVAELLSRPTSDKQHSEIHGRLRNMVLSVVVFALGCMAAALIFIVAGLRVFLLPPLVAIMTLTAIHFNPDPDIV